MNWDCACGLCIVHDVFYFHGVRVRLIVGVCSNTEAAVFIFHPHSQSCDPCGCFFLLCCWTPA